MARKTLTKVRLVKTSDEESRDGLSTQRDTSYAVEAGRKHIGGVIGTWGPGSGRGMYVDRTRYERSWQAVDAEGKTVKSFPGWYEYRDAAVDAVVREAGLR